MSARLLLLCSVPALAAAIASCSAPSATRDSAGPSGSGQASPVPMGRLGYPIGTFLTISGTRAELHEAKVGAQTLHVDTVDGKRLDAPARVWIDNVGPRPGRTRCTFRGYESGRWIGVPAEVLEVTGARGPQAAWQFRPYFIVVSVEKPASLRANIRSPLGEPAP